MRKLGKNMKISKKISVKNGLTIKIVCPMIKYTNRI